MGVISGTALGALGKELGGEGIGGDILGGLMGIAGGMIPWFERGGWVNHPAGEPVIAMLHGNEFVLPQSVNPTKKQVEAVRRLKGEKKPSYDFR